MMDNLQQTYDIALTKFPDIKTLALGAGKHAGFCTETVTLSTGAWDKTEREFNVAQLCSLLQSAILAQRAGEDVRFATQETFFGVHYLAG